MLADRPEILRDCPRYCEIFRDATARARRAGPGHDGERVRVGHAVALADRCGGCARSAATVIGPPPDRSSKANANPSTRGKRRVRTISREQMSPSELGAARTFMIL